MMIIRKISIGSQYKSGAMHYALGQEVFGGHTIAQILAEDGSHIIYIQKGDIVKPWKRFNPNVAITVEYELEY